MRNLVSSAAYRIAFTYSAAFALAILVLGVIVYFAADAGFRAQQDAGIAEESAALVREFGEGGLPDLQAAIAKRESGRVFAAYGFALFDRDGRKIGGALKTPRPASGPVDIVVDDPREGADPARALASDLSDGYRLVVARDPEELEWIDGTIVAVFGGAFLLVIALEVVGAIILANYLRRRLGRISGAAQAIMAGDLDRRVPVGVRGDEFDALGSSLNAMLDRIGQLLDNLRQVSSDVAHDLRTPLARLRGEIEQALDRPGDDAANRAALKRALQRSDELLSLFAAILRISEIEAGTLARSFARVDVSALACDLFESYVPAVSDSGREIAAEIEPGIAVRGDRELIAQALINLLDNAQRHTPAGTRLLLAVDASEDWVRLAIADTGPGVMSEDRARIVRRFVRLEGSRSMPGHGLGLNLVAAVAAAHGGELILGDNHPGLCATITMPRLAA